MWQDTLEPTQLSEGFQLSLGGEQMSAQGTEADSPGLHEGSASNPPQVRDWPLHKESRRWQWQTPLRPKET